MLFISDRWLSHVHGAFRQGSDYGGTLFGFAAQKLIGGPVTRELVLSERPMLAILSTLLALEYHSETVSDRLEEETQIARHMRVCVHISSDFHSITSASPSEPILAEGALGCLKQAGANLGQMLSTVLGKTLVAAGERGEHVAALLLLKANLDARAKRNSFKVPLLDFLKCLLGTKVLKFGPSTSGKVSLEKAFKGAYVYINHVIRLGTHETAKASRLWAIVARGGLIALANGHKGADLLMMICMDDKVNEESVTYMIIQIKRDGTITYNNAPSLFAAMDPDTIGLYPPGHTLKHPIIRLVMSFRSKPELLEGGKVEPTRGMNFTSYDIWCGGMDNTIYPWMSEDEPRHYLSALNICTPLSKAFNVGSKERENVRRSRLPGFQVEGGHWNWADVS